MNKQNTNLTSINFWAIARSRIVVARAVRVAIIVGTVLAIINYGGKIISMNLSHLDLIKMLVTYLVPFGVSTWSSVQAIKDADLNSNKKD